MKLSFISLGLIAISLCFAVTNCDSNTVPPGNKEVCFQLNWTPDPTFTGAYIAADASRNYFAQEGLDVAIQAGG